MGIFDLVAILAFITMMTLKISSDIDKLNNRLDRLSDCFININAEQGAIIHAFDRLFKRIDKNE